MTRTQVYMVCDCSGSMAGDLEDRMRAMVRENLETLRDAAGDFSVTLVPFSRVARREMPFSPAELLRRPERIAAINTNYPFGGNTALLDAVGLALEDAAKTLDDTPALVMVFTDGEENASSVHSPSRLQALLTRLNTSGNLTVTLAGPSRVGTMLSRLGLAEGNFRSWDGSVTEFAKVQKETRYSLDTYVKSRAAGATRSTAFYADASALTPAGIRAMTKEVKPVVDTVSKRLAGRAIADFFGQDFKKGHHYYELVKTEKIQDGKELVIYIKASDEYRLGSRAVRALLGLPETGEIRVAPSAHNDKYDIYVQSDSVNRKVVEGQRLLTVSQ